MYNQNVECVPNGIFAWTSLYAGTTYTHMKHISCRQCKDPNKVSLDAKALQLLDECTSQSVIPDTGIIDEKNSSMTVFLSVGNQYSLQIIIAGKTAAKIVVKNLTAFKQFVQKLNKDSYNKIVASGLPLHGLPTLLMVEQKPKVVDETTTVKTTPEERKKENPSHTKDHDLCKICLENELDILITPCNHLCLCATCAQSLAKQECPFCRETIGGFVKVYKC